MIEPQDIRNQTIRFLAGACGELEKQAERLSKENVRLSTKNRKLEAENKELRARVDSLMKQRAVGAHA